MMESDSDRISNLPTDLTDIILSKLEIEEAARTSVLSKYWRSKWVSLPILDIQEFRTERQQFVNMVNQILIQHSGSIRVFHLYVSKFESCVNIEHWIWYLSMKGLTELRLQLGRPGWYKLNSGLSHFQNLVTLKLRCCLIEIPLGFIGLNSLINLELDCVTLGDVALASLTEKCPLLTYLSLRKMDGVYEFLNIRAPKLEFFVFERSFRSFQKSISFKTNSLVHASIDVFDLPQLLTRAHAFLVRGGYTKKMWEALKTKPRILANIQHLHLESLDFGDSMEMSYALKLIASSPNLDTLSIYVVVHSSFGKLSDVEKMSFSASKLKTVKMEECSGGRCEMEFVELLLSESPVLESIVIKANKYASIFFSHEVLTELTGFRRAAPYARLTFLDYEDNIV